MWLRSRLGVTSWLAIAIAIATSTALEQRSCYFPNGQAALSQPCYQNATTSICCSPGSICLTNGLCQAANVTRELYSPDFLRADCTDQSWRNSTCPQICRGPLDRTNSSHGLLLCDAANDRYCCQRNDTNCCLDPASVFRLPPGRPIRVISEPTPTGTAPARSGSRMPERHRRTALIVGLAVGMGAALLLMVSIYLFWFLRKRAQQRRLQVLADAQAAAAAESKASTAGGRGHSSGQDAEQGGMHDSSRFGRNELDAVEPSEAARETAEVALREPKELDTIDAQVTRELEGDNAAPSRSVSRSAAVSPQTGLHINIVTSDVIELEGGQSATRTSPSSEKEVVVPESEPAVERVGDDAVGAAQTASSASVSLAAHSSAKRETDLDRSAAQTLDLSLPDAQDSNTSEMQEARNKHDSSTSDKLQPIVMDDRPAAVGA